MIVILYFWDKLEVLIMLKTVQHLIKVQSKCLLVYTPI